MARTFFNGRGYIGSGDAEFRVLGKSISDALAAVGLVRCTDTGQLDWDTVTKPATTNTQTAYEIWRFADSEYQTECPVFLKIAYGTGTSTNAFGISVTVCRGTDGAGNVVGDYITYVNITSTSSGTYDRNQNFISSDNGISRLSLMLFVGGSYTTSTSGSDLQVITIDRLRDADGNPTAEGVHFISVRPNNWNQSVLPVYGAKFPNTPLTRPMCLMPPSCSGASAPKTNKRPCVSYIYPYLGHPGNPDMNVFIYPNEINTTGQGMPVKYPFYGSEHTFILNGQMAATNVNGDATVGIGVIYE